MRRVQQEVSKEQSCGAQADVWPVPGVSPYGACVRARERPGQRMEPNPKSLFPTGVVLKLEHESGSPGGLSKHGLRGPTPRGLSSVDPRGNLRSWFLASS